MIKQYFLVCQQADLWSYIIDPELIQQKVMVYSKPETNGPVNAHLISEQIISTKPGYK